MCAAQHKNVFFKPTGRGNYVDGANQPSEPLVWDVSSRDKVVDVRRGVKTVAELRHSLEKLVEAAEPKEEHVQKKTDEKEDVIVEPEPQPQPQPTIHDWLSDLEASLNELLKSANLSEHYLRIVSSQVNEKLDIIKQLADLFSTGLTITKNDENYTIIMSILDWIDEQKSLWTTLTKEEETKTLIPPGDSLVIQALEELKTILRQNIENQSKYIEVLSGLIGALLGCSLSKAGKIDMFWAKFLAENESLPNSEILPVLVEDQVQVLLNAYCMKDTHVITQNLLQEEQSFLDALMAASFTD